MARDSDWTDLARAALERYAEPLRREVAGRLVRPRAAIPADDLAEKCLGTLANPPVVDRRIRELPDAPRKLLAAIGLSRRPTWRAGHLVALSASLGHPDGLAPVFELLENCLLFPDLPPTAPGEIVRFDTWVGWAGMLNAPLFALPAVAARARAEDLGLPVLAAETEPSGSAPRHVADGLDWPLRLAAAWQQVAAGPVRLTQSNSLFKRDLGRFQTDEVLSAAPPDQLVPVPDPGVLAVFWAAAAGLLELTDGELRAVPFPDTWGPQFPPVLAELWAALTAVEAWDPLTGYAPGTGEGGVSAVPTAGLLAMLLLAKLPGGAWADPQAIADWLWEHHPAWGGSLPKESTTNRGRGWVEAYILGVAFPLGLIETAKSVSVSGKNEPGSEILDTATATATLSPTFFLRLTDLGRHLLAGKAEPAAAPAFPQTLVVQPNAEVLAWRQGLTPALIGKLSRFARWKGLGPACTLELTADQTYRGLESGLTLAGMVQTLAQHGTKAVPAAVQDLLRRWADKRERISVYAAATLVEFQTPADLDTAISRGIVALRVTDRIGMTGDGRDPEFQHLRLIGNRDYETKPTRCVTVGDDG
ncbi:MAG: hypothetical protein ACRC7O_03235, partial [Fimbriiglobus sp.]